MKPFHTIAIPHKDIPECRLIEMNRLQKRVIERFKSLILKKLSVHKIVLFGSRARGGAEPYSDMDVLVI